MTATVPEVTRKSEVADHDLRDALSACLLSTSTDATSPTICTVQLDKQQDVLYLRSTDRFRLTLARLAANNDGANFTCMIGTDDVKRLVAALPKRTARGRSLPVTISLDAGNLTVSTFESTTIVRTVEGSFPNIEQIAERWEPGEIPSFHVNPKHLADLAKMPRPAKTAVVLQGGADASKPYVSRWEYEGVNYTHLVMPLRPRT